MNATSNASLDFAEVNSVDVREIIEAQAIPTLDWLALAAVSPVPKPFAIPKLAPAGEVTLFTGPGSAGKSLLGQQLATAKAAGVRTLGLRMEQAPAIFITCEDDEAELHWREKHICASLGVPMESLAGKLEVASLRGQLDNALGHSEVDGEFVLSPTFNSIAALVRRTGAKLVVLDNVAHLFSGNENDRGEVTRFINALNRLAGETGAAILLVGHPNKAGDNYSGSTAWLNAVRSQIVIEHDIKTDVRTLTVGKANYAMMGDAIRFVWVDWAFVLERDLPSGQARQLVANRRAQAADEAFLQCLDLCTERRRNVSHHPGSNYAPKIFAKMPEANGIKKGEFETAMERLSSSGAIEFDAKLWTDDHRKSKRGIRLRAAPQ